MIFTLASTELLKEVPSGIRGALIEGLRRFADAARPWPYADDAYLVRFLLTGKQNGGDAEAYGGALYEAWIGARFRAIP